MSKKSSLALQMIVQVLGNNQSITQEEAEAFQAIQAAGYKVKFQLLPDVSIGYWDDFKSKFGF